MSEVALKLFHEQIKQAQEKIDDFKNQLSKDPVVALTMSSSVFHWAARLRVANVMINELTHHEGAELSYEVSMAKAKEFLTSQILLRSKSLPSGSPTSNLMDQYVTAAYVESLNTLDRIDLVSSIY